MPPTAPPTTVTLDDKYTARHGRVLISGIQAIVRMILVPAVMALLGERAWWTPRRLRDTPRLDGQPSVEHA